MEACRFPPRGRTIVQMYSLLHVPSRIPLRPNRPKSTHKFRLKCSKPIAAGNNAHERAGVYRMTNHSVLCIFSTPYSFWHTPLRQELEPRCKRFTQQSISVLFSSCARLSNNPFPYSDPPTEPIAEGGPASGDGGRDKSTTAIVV